jgi:hypothetical protein
VAVVRDWRSWGRRGAERGGIWMAEKAEEVGNCQMGWYRQAEDMWEGIRFCIPGMIHSGRLSVQDRNPEEQEARWAPWDSGLADAEAGVD